MILHFVSFMSELTHFCFVFYGFKHNFQDDTAFEKQSALFALAVSDIVLINM